MTAVIFDLDGTLIDSAPDIRIAVNKMLAERDKDPLDLHTIIGFVGNGLPKLVERAMRHVGLDLADHAELTNITQTHYKASPSAETRLYPSVMDALAALRDEGRPLGVCTNKPFEPTVQILEELALAPFFDAVLGGDSLKVRKPDPAPLFETARQLNASDYIFVGDSGTDAETADRADAPFLLFTEGYRRDPVEALRHNATFNHYDQLHALVRGLS
ncbi:phosphoglycolate phosphatase [Actibacterium pelagium]|uniref:phosphoglycolate phosphatase n=1 Tax=Actibacterium pelagium TaxID=2029103 RepID=A0A917EJR5_9RHOB|nr:phosphoglycolate phosphatase [Actibacterium pelagium]GGE45684.1 phosphoglycolate phosphatase [Actibacterium pelagium]